MQNLVWRPNLHLKLLKIEFCDFLDLKKLILATACVLRSLAGS